MTYLATAIEGILADHHRCASCGDPAHSIWLCPVEAEKDRVAFAAAMEGIQ